MVGGGQQMSELYVQNTKTLVREIDFSQGKVRQICFTQIVDTFCKTV